MANVKTKTGAGLGNSVKSRKVQKPTINDVAEHAHASISSVSRVVHNHTGINPALRSRIECAIKDLNYNPIPRKRRLKRSYRVIFFILTNRDLHITFHAKVLQAIEEECTRRGDLVLFRTFRYAPETSTEQLELSLKNIISPNGEKAVADGAVFTGGTSPNLLRALEGIQTPFVVLGNNYSGSDLTGDAVFLDLHRGGYDATRYLIDLGHKKILFIGEIGHNWFNEIYTGYLKALSENRLEAFTQTKSLSDSFYSNGYLSVGMALEQSSEMTAILAAADEAALGALQALNERSLAVPREVSIIGFNDDDYAAFTVPPLTTVKIDPHALGRELISLLYRKSNDAPRKPFFVKLPTVLVKRGSCRPLSAI